MDMEHWSNDSENCRIYFQTIVNKNCQIVIGEQFQQQQQHAFKILFTFVDKKFFHSGV